MKIIVIINSAKRSLLHIASILLKQSRPRHAEAQLRQSSTHASGADFLIKWAQWQLSQQYENASVLNK